MNVPDSTSRIRMPLIGRMLNYSSDKSSIPKSIRARIDRINKLDTPALRALNPRLHEYAETAIQLIRKGARVETGGGGSDENLMRLDHEFLPLMAEVQNHRNPQLNLHVFNSQEACYEAIRAEQEKVNNSAKGSQLRVIFPPAPNVPDHRMAMDIRIAPSATPGSPPKTSVVAFESALPTLPIYLIGALKQHINASEPKVRCIITQRSGWDCAMYAMAFLKAAMDDTPYMDSLHGNQRNRYDKEPRKFLKHTQSRGVVKHSPELSKRYDAYLGKGIWPSKYNMSILGERLKNIQQSMEYVMEKAEANPAGSASSMMAAPVTNKSLLDMFRFR